MSKLFSNKYSKYQGAGNDFILIDDRALSFDHTQIPLLCHRKFGIGADGVILLQPSQKADFKMSIFNSDGSFAESCGNGLRCLARFITDLGFPVQNYTIETGSQIVEASYIGDRIQILLGPLPPSSTVFLENQEVHITNTGVPHAVVFVPDPKAIDIAKEGALLRFHTHFQPHGTNVNFAALQSDRSIFVRTFERGLEGESLACGTGAAAVAVIASRKYALYFPIHIQFPGGKLEVGLKNGKVTLLGKAQKVFDAILSFPMSFSQ